MKEEDFSLSSVCGTCGAPLASKYVGEQHVSGEWNVRVKFRCGAAISYSPNFSAWGQTEVCPSDRKELERVRKESELVDNVLDLIKKSDIPDERKTALREEFLRAVRRM
jgi:hypothetical protein